MRKNNNMKIILVIFGVFFGLQLIPINSHIPIDSGHIFNDDLRTNGYWVLPPIFINGSGTGVDAQNWSWVEEQIWFGGGNGSFINPYIIENIMIDGSFSDTCFEIVDSNEYFILRNCTFSGSGPSNDAGVIMNNVNHSKIIDNHFFWGYGDGIYLESSSNNIIFNNDIELCEGCGLRTFFSNFNNISYNNIEQSHQAGIYLLLSNHNKIVNNTVGRNVIYGIYVSNCEYSIFSNNILYRNGNDGMFLTRSPHNIIQNNSFSKNAGSGVTIYNQNHNITFLQNDIIGNHHFGLRCANEIHDIRIFNNCIEYNNDHGIFLSDCENLEIAENTVSYNLLDGMYLSTCNNNTINDNEILHNVQNGIEFYSDCDLNNVSMNSIHYNHLSGLYLRESDNNSIIENYLIGNGNCIAEENCIGNIFINNTCTPVHKIYIELLDHVFSYEEFNITLYIYNENDSGLNVDSIHMWWNYVEVTNDIQNLGNGYYFISLEPITVESGEEPILLNMTVSATGYEDKYFETYIAVEPPEIEKSLRLEITEAFYSIEHFNFTFFVCDESEQGIDPATIQMWWNGMDVSDDVQNLGDGLYFVSLEPIIVVPGEDPVLLNMSISADGYKNTNFEMYLAVDLETLDRGIPPEEFPLAIVIIAITSIVGVVGISILLLRRRKRASE